jgi:hypothetical protein
MTDTPPRHRKRRHRETLTLDGRQFEFEYIPFAHDPPRLMVSGVLAELVFEMWQADRPLTIRRRQYKVSGAEIPVNGIATFYLTPLWSWGDRDR